MNIKEFFQEHGIEYREFGVHHHVTRNHINLDCPQCSPKSGKFRLGWHLSGNYCSCWNCGKLSAFTTLMELTGLPSAEIKQLFVGLESDRTIAPIRAPGKLQIPSGVVPLERWHRIYLRKRGFDKEKVKVLQNLWKVQGIDHSNPRLAWSLFIPIFLNGEMVSWTTRTTGKSNPRRYITASTEQEKVSAKRLLYGSEHCLHTIVVCEGPIDAWKIGPGAVSLMGLAYTREQMLLISQFPDRYICMDNERKAQVVAAKLCDELCAFPGQTHNIVLESGNDPGDASEKELNQIRDLLK